MNTYKVIIVRSIFVEAPDEISAEVKAGEQHIEDWYESEPKVISFDDLWTQEGKYD